MGTRLVLVEDQPEIRQLVRMTLEFGDFELLEAADADAGWTLIEEHRPDLVLLDVMMPGSMDGLELCRRLRARTDGLAKVRVVLLTARSQHSDVEAGRRAGADLYLTKPFSPLELLDHIGALLGGATER
ncbi:response regulator transcription factor [Methyloversatilis sp.]|uniref:response regulator transcription factor n=1 Tax=Methyloversatilis sp. TaxID=2569862 RepID=UPI0035AE6551